MKKLIFLIIICSFVNVAQGVFVIFNNNRAPWYNLKTHGTPITVDSGTELGLTNPNSGITSYSFMFWVEYGNLIFNTSAINISLGTGNSISIGSRPPALFIDGWHTGPGNPIGGIKMYGDAYVNIYEQFSSDFRDHDYELIGAFTVGDPIPEPATFLLLTTGLIGIFKWKKRSKNDRRIR